MSQFKNIFVATFIFKHPNDELGDATVEVRIFNSLEEGEKFLSDMVKDFCVDEENEKEVKRSETMDLDSLCRRYGQGPYGPKFIAKITQREGDGHRDFDYNS